MRSDCVAGESGGPGRHFRANLAQQHLPPSFAADRRGTAGRRRDGGTEGEREAGPRPGLHRGSFEAAGRHRRARSQCTHRFKAVMLPRPSLRLPPDVLRPSKMSFPRRGLKMFGDTTV